MAHLINDTQLATLDVLKMLHRATVTKLQVVFSRLPDCQSSRSGPGPEDLLSRCIRMGLVNQVEELVWRELVATWHNGPPLPPPPPRLGKRKVDDSEATHPLIDMTESSRLWNVCCVSYQQLMTESSSEKVNHLTTLLTIAKRLVGRILRQWPRSTVAVFDAAILSFLCSVLETRSPSPQGRGQQAHCPGSET